MSLTSITESTRTMLTWLRDSAAPAPDSLDASSPLRALERSRLSDEELRFVIAAVRRYEPVTGADVGVEITKVLDALPHPEDVRAVLATAR